MSDSKTADISHGAAIGGGAGAAVGALSTLFQKDKSLRKAIKNALMGGMGGAALGSGIGAIKGTLDDRGTSKQDTSKQDKTSTEKPHMSELTAALSGAWPGVGPAIHGAIEGGAGQALRSGASSLAGSLAGVGLGAAGEKAVHALRGTARTSQRSPGMLIGSLAGSGLGAWLAAKGRNDSTKQAATAPPGTHEPKDWLQGVTAKPFSTAGGAAIGGLGGAALGGGAGLLKALLDSEDDTILSTLDKAFRGAAYGGVGGAALGGGTSYLLRNKLLDRIQGDKDKHNLLHAHPELRPAYDEALSHYGIPARTLIQMSKKPGITREEFDKQVQQNANREAFYDVIAPSLINRHVVRDPSTARAY